MYKLIINGRSLDVGTSCVSGVYAATLKGLKPNRIMNASGDSRSTYYICETFTASTEEQAINDLKEWVRKNITEEFVVREKTD